MFVAAKKFSLFLCVGVCQSVLFLRKPTRLLFLFEWVVKDITATFLPFERIQNQKTLSMDRKVTKCCVPSEELVCFLTPTQGHNRQMLALYVFLHPIQKTKRLLCSNFAAYAQDKQINFVCALTTHPLDTKMLFLPVMFTTHSKQKNLLLCMNLQPTQETQKVNFV